MKTKSGEEETVFSEETEIPAIQTDFYSMSNGTAEIFDINFLNEKKDDFGNKKLWDTIREKVVLFSKVILYVGIVLLLTLLIYKGITFVLSVLGRKCWSSKEHKRGN